MLRILGLWDVPSEDLDIFHAPLRATLGSTPGVDIFFAHRHTDNWQKAYKTSSINAFIFLSAQDVSMDCLPRDFSGPVCILDLRAFYASSDSRKQPTQCRTAKNDEPSPESIPSTPPSHEGLLHKRISSPDEHDSHIRERKELHDIYRFTPPFPLGVLLNTLRKSLLSFPRSSPPQSVASQMGNIIFDRPHKRCIRHPECGDIFLTEKEVAILDLLMENAPQKLTKKVILEAVWGYLPQTALNTHTLETHIYRLRQKFEEHGLASIILSDHEGYAFNGAPHQKNDEHL